MKQSRTVMTASLAVFIVIALAIAISLSVLELGNGGDRDSGERVREQGIELRRNTASGASLSSLVAAYPDVFVGEVVEVRYQWADLYSSTTYDIDEFAQPDEHLRPSQSPRYVQTYLTVNVSESVNGRFQPGDVVTIYQPGGEAEAADGKVERWTVEGDRSLTKGTTYLFIAGSHPGLENTLFSPPWGKFEVSGGDLVAVNDVWADLGAVSVLDGKHVEDVDLLVADAARGD
jgi:hypothetical protein